ncbi:MAG: ABC transporter permease [Chloroflexota bacterium]|nr:ABC transporter permease [Chloroflexota bacterium]
MLANKRMNFIEEEWSLDHAESFKLSTPTLPVVTDWDEPEKQATPRKTWLKSHHLSKAATPLTLLGLLGLWQLLTSLALYPEYILPTPIKVAARFGEVAQSGALWRHMQTTLLEAALGFGSALLVVGLLCYPIAHSRLVASLLSPILAATQAIPLVAIAPLLVIWFGFGLPPKVITCALIVFFPLLLNAVAGLKGIDKSLTEAASVCGASRWQAFWWLELPLALPTMLTGVKIGFTVAITGAVVGEFISSDSGLGYLLNLGRGQFDTALVFVALLTLTAIAMAAYGLVGLVEKRFANW